jgi:hypothetical protein
MSTSRAALGSIGDRKPRGEAGARGRGVLPGHAWPGNIRELQNAIERALIVSDGGLLTPEQFRITLGRNDRADAASSLSPSGITPESGSTSRAESPAEIEKRSIVDAFSRAKGDRSRTVTSLGLSRTPLDTRLSIPRTSSDPERSSAAFPHGTDAWVHDSLGDAPFRASSAATVVPLEGRQGVCSCLRS